MRNKIFTELEQDLLLAWLKGEEIPGEHKNALYTLLHRIREAGLLAAHVGWFSEAREKFPSK